MYFKTVAPLALTQTLLAFGAQAQQPQSPNLIIILADDLGYADVDFNGCKDIPTPNIDRIANNGVKFTNAYTSYSVSSPSRAGIMTGRYGQRFGFERNPPYEPHEPTIGLPLNEKTLAETLSKVGYTSEAIGKWHLGADVSNHPMNRGFNNFFGHLGGAHKYFPKDYTIKDSYAAIGETESYVTWIMRGHEPVQTKKYLTDEFSDEAVNFVSKNKNNPFFLYLAYNAPHNPMEATEEYLSRFPNIQNKTRKTYAAMVSAVDDGVGRLLDKLEELKIDDNTLVFFLSDNGGPVSHNGSNNGPLRDQKGSVYEGGFRVPFAFMWKGKISHGVYDKTISSLDIYATISALSGAPLDAKKPLDGVNLIPYLTGKNSAVPHENIYLRMFDAKKFAVRSGDYKLVTQKSGAIKELYDLRNDIGETKNLADEKPGKVSEIDALRAKWASQLIDPVFVGRNKDKNKEKEEK